MDKKIYNLLWQTIKNLRYYLFISFILILIYNIKFSSNIRDSDR